MLASELIKELQDLMAKHGDLPVVGEREEITVTEFNTDDGEVFVIE